MIIYRLFYPIVIGLIGTLVKLAANIRCAGEGNEWYMQNRVLWSVKENLGWKDEN